MARSNGRKSDAPARTPIYHVVRVEGDRLTIVRRDAPAKNQEAASDAYVDSLPPDQRNGEYGAFLASSLKSWPYESETVIVTRKKAAAATRASVTEKAESPDPVAVS